MQAVSELPQAERGEDVLWTWDLGHVPLRTLDPSLLAEQGGGHHEGGTDIHHRGAQLLCIGNVDIAMIWTCCAYDWTPAQKLCSDDTTPAQPMINIGTWRDVTWPDGWTSTTADGSRSAQFEHTLLVTATGCEILTQRLDSSPPLWWEQNDK